MMELWDAYDEKLNKIDGAVLMRGEGQHRFAGWRDI